MCSGGSITFWRCNGSLPPPSGSQKSEGEGPMTFTEGLLKARSHLIFLLGLVVAFGIVIKLEMWDIQRQPGVPMQIPKLAPLPTVTPTALTAQEQQWARIAWQYFVTNYQPTTGLVNSVDRYPA